MATKSKNKNFFTSFFKLLFNIVIVFVCLITFLLLYYIINAQIHSEDENYKPFMSIYTIVSPSMTPVINVYDVVINVRANNPADIKVGDIITYKSLAANSEGMTITHRVIKITKLPDGTYEYITQGDNNSEPDSLYVKFDSVIGKEILIIPYLGKIQFVIANQKGWLFLLLIPVSIYMIRELLKLFGLVDLNKKVIKITKPKVIAGNIENKVISETRKRELSLDLKRKNAEKMAKFKSQFEPASFLEPYSETVIEVSNNKYLNPIPNQEVFIEDIEDTAPKKVDVKNIKKRIKESKEEIELVLPKLKSTTENYEVLETDELTSKIIEYEEKIDLLETLIKETKELNTKKEQQELHDNLLTNVDELERLEESIVEDIEQLEETFVEKEDYLVEQKIKVIAIESTNNKIKKDIEPKSKKLQAVEVLSTTQVPEYNPRMKIARPESEDIHEFNKKERLNLNPKKIKKITRSPKRESPDKLALNPNKRPKVNRSRRKTSKNLNLKPNNIPKVKNTNKKKSNNNLNLNPKNIQKVNRQPKKKKKPFIIIEKVK